MFSFLAKLHKVDIWKELECDFKGWKKDEDKDIL